MRKNITEGAILVIFAAAALLFNNSVSADKSVTGRSDAKTASQPETASPMTLPFTQNWTTTTLITTNDDWSGVPGIQGFRGDNLTALVDADPRTILEEGTPVIDVNANQTDPNVFATGGVAEFDTIANPVVALQGSGTADAPSIVLYLNTTGQNNIRVQYNARDIDASIANVTQQIATQYRVGSTGNFINVPGGYIADASSGPSTATLVTPVAVTLPPGANNKPEVQVRIITTNAVGADGDEWIGIDDISVTAGGPVNTARTSLDFNGDGKTDFTVTRPAGGLKTWYIATNGSGAASQAQWGLSTDKDTPSDFDGDGKTDIAVWRENGPDPNKAYFFILQSATGTLKTEQFGKNGDSPQIVGDYDGDGKADPAVFRGNGTAAEPCGIGKSVFYYRPSGTPATDYNYVCWGQNLDVPTGGDFDGDGKFDFCVRRDNSSPPAFAAVFLLRRSSDSGTEQVWWGLASRPGGLPPDAIVPGDYDGDGKYDFAVARINGSTGEFYILERDGGGTGNSPITIGGVTSNDLLAGGDYDGDGRTDIGLWRGNASPGGSFFAIRKTSTGAFDFFTWGQLGDESGGEWNVTGGG